MNILLTKAIAFASASLILLSSPLSGAIDVQSGSGTWTNPGGSPANFTGAGTDTIHWGFPASGINNSGYNFTSLAPITNIALDTPFALGTFTHYNFPITGNAITSINLNVDAVLNINGNPQAFSGIYNFLHNETPNIQTLQDPNCCNDIVTFQNNTGQSSTFLIGGVEYTIGLIGFKTSVNGSLLSQFSTVEGQQNVATLFATISTPQTLAPEPSTYLILGSFLVVAFLLPIKRRNLASEKNPPTS